MNRKTKIIIIIAAVAFMVVGSLIEKKWNETEQQKAFIENIGVPLSDNETKFVEQFYADLTVVYNDFQLADLSESFNTIPPKKEDDIRQIRFMTIDLLYAVCDSNHVYDPATKFSDMNATMGTSSFRHYLYSRDWDSAFLSDLQYLYQEKYFAVVQSVKVEWPEVNKGEDFYYTGTIEGNVAIYDLSSLKCVSVSHVNAENSEDAEVKSFLKIEAQKDKLKKDLLKQYRKAIIQSMKVSLDIK